MPPSLQAPLLIREAAVIAARARALRLPVWLVGGPGCGAYALARALHRGGEPAGFVSVRRLIASPGDLDSRIAVELAADSLVDSLSLYVERIDRQPSLVQERILRLADEGIRGGGRSIVVRLLAQSDGAGKPIGLLPALEQRLSMLQVLLPPLAERRADIPAIARLLVREVARDLGVPEPRLADAAVAELAEREWPGNLEELEAVVAQTLLRASGALVESFVGAAAPAPARETRAPHIEPAGTPPPPLDPRGLEFLIAELAHELKNPMVTIKTFAQHFDKLLPDPDLRDRFVRMATEAVDRMDGFLEELLRFSRFADPKPRTLTLYEMACRTLAASDPSLRERVHANGMKPGTPIRLDEEQIAFALQAIIRGFAKQLPPGSPIFLDLPTSADILVRSNVKDIGQKLAGFFGHEGASAVERSLDFVLADALIRRNGGRSRVVLDAERLEVQIAFPDSP